MHQPESMPLVSSSLWLSPNVNLEQARADEELGGVTWAAWRQHVLSGNHAPFPGLGHHGACAAQCFSATAGRPAPSFTSNRYHAA